MRIVSINVHYQDGLGYQDYYLGKALMNLGHEVIFVASDWHFRFPDYENTVQKIIGPRYVGHGDFKNEYGAKIVRLKSRLINGLYWLKNFKETIVGLNPDLIISHGVFTFQSVRLTYYNLNCPIIFDDHTTKTFYRTDKISSIVFFFFRRMFSNRIYKRAKKIVGVSDSCILVLDSLFGLKGEKVKLIPLGADIDTYFPNLEYRNEYREKLSLSPNDILVVYTGKIYEVKKLHVIFEVLNMVSVPDGKNLVFHVVGDISKDYVIKFEKASKNFIHRFVYSNAVNQTDLAKIYNAADLCVWLDFTNSTIEASACGCPVIVTDLMPERVNGLNGKLVNRENIPEIVQAIENLINSADLVNCRKDCVEFVSKSFSWETIAHKFVTS